MEGRELDSQSSQTNDLRNLYLSLPSLSLGITGIGQGLVSSIIGLIRLSGKFGHDAGGLDSQWRSTI